MKTDTVIFDLDGTLIDTLDDLKNAVNHALETRSMPARTRKEVCAFVGNGMGLLVRRAAGEDVDEPTYNDLFSAFTAYYNAHYADCTLPYPGIRELLTALKARGLRTAVLTNKRAPAAQALCDRFFPGLLDAVAGEIAGVPRKPDRAAAERLLRLLGADPARTLYVGDSQVDVDTARNAGLGMVAVTWGFRSRKTLEEYGASRLIDRPAELLDYLEAET